MDIKIPEIGDWVAWRWAAGVAEGKVIEISYERKEIISKGKRIARNGSPENPALVMDHKSGNPVIKLASELMHSS